MISGGLGLQLKCPSSCRVFEASHPNNCWLPLGLQTWIVHHVSPKTVAQSQVMRFWKQYQHQQ
eukprot:3611244-Amphidinium_carterae.1